MDAIPPARLIARKDSEPRNHARREIWKKEGVVAGLAFESAAGKHGVDATPPARLIVRKDNEPRKHAGSAGFIPLG